MIDNSTKEQIKVELIKFCSNAGSDNKASKLLGIANSYVSLIKRNMSEPLSDDMWRKLANKLKVDMSDEWVYAATAPSEAFKGIFKTCKAHGLFRGIIAKQGTCKTYMLDNIRLSSPNVFYVKCIEDISKKELYQEILLSMGRPHVKGSVLVLLKLIVAEMEKIDSPLLVIDEIEDCKTAVLRQVKDIYNRLDGICSVIFLGTPNLKLRIETLYKRGSLAFNQVVSRFGGLEFQEIPANTTKDASLVIRAQGISDQTIITSIINGSEYEFHDGIDMRSVKRLVLREKLLQEVA